MNDFFTYKIILMGEFKEDEINPTSPVRVVKQESEAGLTTLRFSTDQSGLVGLIRTLHGLGFVFLSIQRK
jgi:hypothetical protein